MDNPFMGFEMAWLFVDLLVSLGVLFLILEATLIPFVPEPITWLPFRVPVAFFWVQVNHSKVSLPNVT